MKKLILVSLLFGSCMAGSSDFSSNGLLVRLMGLLESVGTGTTSIQGEQTLSGYLKDEDGNAIVNATLNLQSEASSVLRATNTTTTDSEGKFSLTFKIGSYKVTVQSSTGSSLGVYSVSATSPTVQPTLTLQSGNLTLTVNNFNNSSAPLSPSILTFGSSSYTFTSGLSISKITPTVSGTLTSCTARPSLPTGLSLSSTCEISGTPNVIQSSVAYLIRGRNSFGDTISKITITINRQPPSSLSYIGSPFTFTQGAFISTITPSISGTVTSCSISPSLTSDTGLLFNTTNCSISGTATQVKSATNYTVTASNSSGSTSTTINITVNNSPPSGLNYSGAPFVFTQNVAISSRSVSVTGTVTSCSISPNLTLNTGLTFNTTNCSISGTPTLVSSATNYTVTASNSNGSTTNSVSVAVNIAPPSSLSYSGSPFTFTQNLAISSRTPSVTGTINSCSITPNLTTNTGLTFNTTNCTISGTPTQVKSATNYTVTASNSNGSTSTTVNITVNIAPPSSLSYSGSPFVFTQNIAITSKTPTVTGTISSCSISPNIQTDTGLNFNTTNCTISGTPTIIKSATNYTVTASNSNGSTSTTINITVNIAPPSNLSYSGSPFVFTQNAAITSQSPAVTGTVTSCSISPNIQTDTGLNFNTTNCTISGTPTIIKTTTNYTITASNSNGSTSTTVNITVNIAPPSSLSYSGSPYVFTQNVAITSRAPTVTGTVTSCTISPNIQTDTGLNFNSTNCTISGTPTIIKTATNYTITASNSNGSTSTTVNVTVNISPPSSLSYSGSPFVFTQNIAITSQSPAVTGTVTSCSISPNIQTDTGLNFNSSNCIISGTPTILKTATNYTITASNSNGSTSTTVNITVNIAPPSSLSYSGSPFVFTQNIAITSRTPTVTGTVSSCSISPNIQTDTGLNFNSSNCTINGTPTIIKTATNYTITASNSNGSTSTTVNITVNIAPPSSLSYSGSPFVFTQNIAITSQSPAVTGTVSSCSISPNIQTDTGLNFNTTNCTISGTPTIIKTATNYTITASNSNGSTSTTINITVNIALPSNLSYSGSPFVFTQNIAITSRTPTVTGTITSCSISPNIQTDTGLNFNSSNCTISGTPTILRTSTNYTVTASNSNGSNSTTINITVNIAPPSNLSYSGSPFVFTQNVAITSRTPTVTGTVTSCNISPNIQTDTGLNFNSTNCTISGTPTIIKTATNYTITASNSNGSTSTTVNITVNIAPPSNLSFSGSPLVFTQNVAITSRTPTVTGTVTSCSISPNIQTDTGLNFNSSNCTISGTPTIIKTATNYTITASNSNGSTSTTINIAVNNAPPSSLSYSGSPFVFIQNAAISSRTPTVTGTITLCSISPNIQTDTGLNLNTTNCTISGTPTIIKTATNYTVTASNTNGSTNTVINIRVALATESGIVSMPLGLLKTGQTTSYARESNGVTPCCDDGFYQKGLARTFIVGGMTGLIWQRCSGGQNNDASCSGIANNYTWSNANTYCNTLSLGGKTWRLPTVNELKSLVDYGKFSSSIDIISFPNTQPVYWSSITNLDTNFAWTVSFTDGNVTPRNKTSGNFSYPNGFYVRCISDQ